MIILEAIEAPTTLGERIAASETEVELLNRRSLNATMFIPLAFVLTVVSAGVSGYLAEQLGLLQASALIPPAVIGGFSFWLGFRTFDRRSDAHLTARSSLKELKAEASALEVAKAEIV